MHSNCKRAGGRVEITLDKRPCEKYILKPNEKLIVSNEAKETNFQPTEAKEPIVVLDRLKHTNDSTIVEIRIMKLTFLFYLLTCLQVSAKTYSQDKITGHLQSVELKKALNVIERKSNYHFLYNEAVIANKPKIDLNVKDVEITSIYQNLCNY